MASVFNEGTQGLTKVNDEVSVYNGVSPASTSTATWQEVVDAIRDGNFAAEIAKARSITDLDAYREYKKTLPAVTFCGTFNGRRAIDNVQSATGFIIADIDHVDDVDGLFSMICEDDHVWFAFRSPSGHGIKAGLRLSCVENDQDIKSFYASIENYFQSVYSVQTDSACKDISRLTFLSHDPDTFVNADALYFPVETWAKKEEPKPQKRGVDPVFSVGHEKYAWKVIESCCQQIRESISGQQHNTRIRMGRLAGGYVHYLNHQTVYAALEDAVVSSGAKKLSAAMSSIRWGMGQGEANPITIPDLVSNGTSNGSDGSDGNNSYSRCSDGGLTDDSRCSDDMGQKTHAASDDKRPRYCGNLAGDIKKWLDNRTGCVTKREIWDEFGLVHPLDKQNLRQILHSLVKEESIYKDRYKADTYWIKEGEFQYDDLDEADEADSGLRLPLNLHDLMTVPRGSVFLLEGCTNAGKTAFCFNVLRENFATETPLRYIYSEGSKSEVALRMSSFVNIMGDDRDAWKHKLKTAFFPNNHHQFILQQNPTGLTVVDYVRAVDGDFTKMGPAIDLIAESAGQGFVMVCVQKKTGNAYGVGGQNNHFAPRNVFSLDFVCKDNGYDFCVLTIKKCKYPRDFLNNPDGKEIHLAIRGGVELTQLCKPMFCDEANRKKLFAQYRQEMFGKRSSMCNMDVPF